MISGIYKITFPSGKRYIGKSIDVDTRWKQHTDKLRKGDAAKNMQEQWNTYREFIGEVIFECHPDHIDIMESYFIARLNPELNTTRPADPFPGLHGSAIDDMSQWFQMSTLKHTQYLNEFTKQVDNLMEVNEDLLKDLKQAARKRSEEEIKTEVGKQLSLAIKESNKKDKEIANLNQQISSLSRHIQYLNQPWWKKLF